MSFKTEEKVVKTQVWVDDEPTISANGKAFDEKKVWGLVPMVLIAASLGLYGTIYLFTYLLSLAF